MEDLYWDEVLVTNNPDSKTLEVSFKKIDGDGLLSIGEEPGTPGGVIEGTDGSQPPVDPEGDFDPIVDDPDGELPEGNPIDPAPDANPECLPQDCSALDDYVDPPEVVSTYLWKTDSSDFAGDAIPGMTHREVGDLGASQGYPMRDIQTRQVRDVSEGYGPCGQPADLWGAHPFAGGISNIRNVPNEVFPYQGQYINIGDEVDIQGSLSVYVTMRDLDGQIPTSGSKYAALVTNQAFAWCGQFSIGASPVASSGSYFCSIVQDNDTGRVYFDTTDGEVELNSSGDATGVYTVSYRNKITRTVDGVFCSAQTTVEGLGGKVESVRVGALEQATVNCWFPRLIDKSAYPNYLVGANTNGVTITGASHGGTPSQLQDWVTAYQRSQQEYTPPDYCSRIP